MAAVPRRSEARQPALGAHLSRPLRLTAAPRSAAERAPRGEGPSFPFAADPTGKEKGAALGPRDAVLLGRSAGAKKAAANGRSYTGKGGFNRVSPTQNTHPAVKPIAIMSWLPRLDALHPFSLCRFGSASQCTKQQALGRVFQEP